MRKFLIILGLIVTGLIIYFLQVNVFSVLTIAGIKPNLLIIYILCIGLYASSLYGIGLGVFFGLLLDLIFGKVIGISAIMFCIVGYLGSYFLSSIILNFDAEYFAFLKMLILEIIYNVLLVIILYPLIQKVGYWLDRNFKKTNILTRYF